MALWKVSFCGVLTLAGAASPSRAIPGDGSVDAGEDTSIAALTDPGCPAWTAEMFASTGHHDGAVEIAADLRIDQTCGCSGSPMFAQPSNEAEWDSLDCLCESFRTCTPMHARAYFSAAASNILFDYFVVPDPDGGCSLEVFTGGYDVWMDEGSPERSSCRGVSCAVDDRGNLRGTLQGCPD